MRELTEKELNNSIKYWCDIFGFQEPDMPETLKKAMKEIWEESAGNSYCMMAEYDDKYFIALKYEYDGCFANDMGLSMYELYEQTLLKGYWLEENKKLSTSVFLLSKGEEYHELIILVPADIPKSSFYEIAQLCEEVVYNIKDLPAEERNWRAMELAVRYGSIDGAHHKTWVIDQMIRILAGNKYDAIVAEACDGEDGSNTYIWDCGIAP